MWSEENSDLWLNFMRRRIPRDQHILSEPLAGQHCVCAYDDKAHGKAHVIPYLIRLAESKNEPALVCCWRQADRAAIVCIADGKLQLANIYEAATKEQLLYWVLTIYEEHSLAHDVPLYVRCGDTTRKLLYAHVNTNEL